MKPTSSLKEVGFVFTSLGSKSRFADMCGKHTDISVKHTDIMRFTADKVANLFTKEVASTLFIIPTERYYFSGIDYSNNLV